ncbi:MAG: ATP-binding protein [Acidobacteriota bacterium]|nr:ATP-binding protein [Acidobacteriota bacterium]
MKRWTLRRRLNTLLVAWFALFLAVVGTLAAIQVAKLRAAEQSERELLARSIAGALDAILGPAMQNLGRLPQQMSELDASATGALRAFRFSFPFRSAVYVVDAGHRVLASDPPDTSPLPAGLLRGHVAVTSLFSKQEGDEHMFAAIVQPIRRAGSDYWLVAEMDPDLPALREFLPEVRPGDDIHVLVIDAEGRVIAADEHDRVFQRIAAPEIVGDRVRHHKPFVVRHVDCPSSEAGRDGRDQMMVVAPLQSAPWAVVVMQHESRILTPLLGLGRGVAIAALALVGMGVVLSLALTRSVVAPIARLSRDAKRLRDGDMKTPIAVDGDQEIVTLSGTLEDARRRVASSMDQLERMNRDLEQMVASRTASLAKQYRTLTLQHAVAQACVQHHGVEGFAPVVLERFARHFELPAAALEAVDKGGRRRMFVHPPAAAVDGLSADTRPLDWEEQKIEYLGRLQGRILYPGGAEIEPSVIESLQHQLAVAIHGAGLWSRIVRQDRERRALVRRMLGASEEERKRIARELHDEIAQLLTVIQLSLEQVDSETPAVARTRKHLVGMQKEIRRIIYDLRPSLIDDLGLAAAIESHATSSLVERGMTVSLEIDREVAGSPEIDLTMFRIFQEIVTNVLRHARAESVSVELYESDGRLTLAVEDDGRGFDVDAETEGAGLVGIRERADLVGGEVEIDSEPGTGTQVVVRIPLEP